MRLLASFAPPGFLWCALLVGTSGFAQQSTSTDPREILREFCAHYTSGYCPGPEPSPGPASHAEIQALLQRGVDVVPLLIEIAQQQDHTYVLNYRTFPGSHVPERELWGDERAMRLRCVENALETLWDLHDSRATDFFIETVVNRKEDYSIRGFAATRLNRSLGEPRVQDLVCRMLRTPEEFSRDPRWAVRTALSLCEWIPDWNWLGDWRLLADAIEARYRLEEQHLQEYEVKHKSDVMRRIWLSTLKGLRRLTVVETQPESGQPGIALDTEEAKPTDPVRSKSPVDAYLVPGPSAPNPGDPDQVPLSLVGAALLGVCAAILVVRRAFRR